MVEMRWVGVMAGQVLNICMRNNIRIHIARDGLRALPFASTIEIGVIESDTDYAGAMHEIGHILGEEQDQSFVIEYEASAWKWAEENALAWTKEMNDLRREKLSRYIINAHKGKMRGGVYPIHIPDSSHYVWKWVDLIDPYRKDMP